MNALDFRETAYCWIESNNWNTTIARWNWAVEDQRHKKGMSLLYKIPRSENSSKLLCFISPNHRTRLHVLASINKPFFLTSTIIPVDSALWKDKWTVAKESCLWLGRVQLDQLVLNGGYGALHLLHSYTIMFLAKPCQYFVAWTTSEVTPVCDSFAIIVFPIERFYNIHR